MASRHSSSCCINRIISRTLLRRTPAATAVPVGGRFSARAVGASFHTSFRISNSENEGPSRMYIHTHAAATSTMCAVRRARWLSTTNGEHKNKQDSDVDVDVEMELQEIRDDDNNTRSSSSSSSNDDGSTDGDSSAAGSGEEKAIDRSLFTQEVKVRMPDMGEGEGKVLKWYKAEGDIIHRDDILCDIETPDFTFGMVTDDQGPTIMGEILATEGQEMRDAAVICITWHKEDS